jgi:acetoin utilization deacetylase AcuC-like enzyme
MGVRHAVRQPPRGDVSSPAVVTASGHDAHDPAIEVAGDHALVVSLGVDALEGDTAGGGRLAPADHGPIGARLAELNLPAVVVLEGGYLLERVGPAVAAFWEGLTVHSVAVSGGGR